MSRGGIGLAIWSVLGSLGCFVACVLGGLFVRGDSGEPFPGDPPVADLVVVFSLPIWVFALIPLLASWISARSKSDHGVVRVVRLALTIVFAASLLLVGPSLLRVLERHFGEWTQVKQALRDGEKKVQELTGKTSGQLSEAEIAIVGEWFSRNASALTFTKPTLQHATIRLSSNLPPYVGVDFGGGKNATFDVDTMLCIRSD